MSEITITITADEDDLRSLVADHAALQSGRARRLTDAIAAALPKPRIVVRRGMVLRHKATDARFMAVGDATFVSHLKAAHSGLANEPPGALDPDEWEVILDV